MPNDEVKLAGYSPQVAHDLDNASEFIQRARMALWTRQKAGGSAELFCMNYGNRLIDALDCLNRRAIPSTVSGETKERLPVMSATAVEDELSGKLVWDCHEIDGRDGEQMPVVELAAETFAVGTTIQIFEPGRGEVS